MIDVPDDVIYTDWLIMGRSYKAVAEKYSCDYRTIKKKVERAQALEKELPVERIIRPRYTAAQRCEAFLKILENQLQIDIDNMISHAGLEAILAAGPLYLKFLALFSTITVTSEGENKGESIAEHFSKMIQDAVNMTESEFEELVKELRLKAEEVTE